MDGVFVVTSVLVIVIRYSPEVNAGCQSLER